MKPEKMRKYWHPGLNMYVPSITSCDVDSKVWLAPWAAKATLECAMEFSKTKPVTEWTEEDIKWIKKETSRQSERGRDIGTIFHEMSLDGFLKTGAWTSPENCKSWGEVCESARDFSGYEQMKIAFQEWCDTYLKEVIDVEFVVFGSLFAGRCDWLGVVSNYAWLTKKAQKTEPEKLFMTYCDLKTSSQYSEFTPLQLSGYKIGDGRKSPFTAEKLEPGGLIVRVDKDNAVHNIIADKKKTVVYTKYIEDLDAPYQKLMNRVNFIWADTEWEKAFTGVPKSDDVVESEK